MKNNMTKNDSALPETTAAAMPSPFPAGREGDSIVRKRLEGASPKAVQVQQQVEALRQEAAELEAQADAAAIALAQSIETLKSLLEDERKLVSQAAFFARREVELPAELAGAEAALTDAALRPGVHGETTAWTANIARLATTREELTQVKRVRPLVEAALDDICRRREELQVSLGFAPVSVDRETGALVGSVPEPPALRYAWSSETPTGSAVLRPVGRALSA